MKIILREEVDNLGSPGEIVTVKDGFARNFLIPKNFALRATSQNMKFYEREKQKLETQKLKEKQEAEELSNKLSSVSLTATVSVGDEDKVFGSVTSQNIGELLSKAGFDIDRRKIKLDEPLKALGVYEIPIKLHSEVETKIKVWVVKE